jgi:hypothetical protein
MDPDGDGEVSLFEFLEWWSGAGVEMKKRMTLLADASLGEEERQRRRKARVAIEKAQARFPGTMKDLAKLDFQSKLAVHLEASKRADESQIAATLESSRQLFDEIDVDGSGDLDKEELRSSWQD